MMLGARSIAFPATSILVPLGTANSRGDFSKPAYHRTLALTEASVTRVPVAGCLIEQLFVRRGP